MSEFNDVALVSSSTVSCNRSKTNAKLTEISFLLKLTALNTINFNKPYLIDNP